jgi:hypothetical protein
LVFVGQLQFAFGLELLEVIGVHLQPTTGCVPGMRKLATSLDFALFANLG